MTIDDYDLMYSSRFGTVGETEKRTGDGVTKDSITESKPTAERLSSGRLNSGDQSAMVTTQPESGAKDYSQRGGSMPDDTRQNKR